MTRAHEIAGSGRRWITSLLPALGLALLLAGCGGLTETETNPPPNNGGNDNGNTYSGPAPQTDDVQAFKLNVWDNITQPGRCAGCHGTGGQTPQFARDDDINLAYAVANGIVDLASPADSLMVTKVGGGHNCWQADAASCATILTTWISNWAGGAAGGGTQIELTDPPIIDPGESIAFPADPSLFSSTVYPVLTQYCAGCHTNALANGQSPFFASADLDLAYAAAIPKIDLNDPARSRLVQRLRNEFHNCWDDCEANADEMQAAIEALAGQLTPTVVDPSLVISKALKLTDGVVAAGGNRFDTHLIARWEFKTGSGAIAYDTSGVDPALNLNFIGDVDWVGGWGIEFGRDGGIGRAQGSTTASGKLHSLIGATGEYSLEAWVVPANVTQEGPARIVTYAGAEDSRNFMLGQSMYNYDFYNRSSVTDGNGAAALSTPDADEVLQATQQHVVVTFDPANGRRIYVNGNLIVEDGAGGNLNDWDDTFAFALGSEVSNNNAFTGKLRFVGVHNRALTAEQVTQNFNVGVGEKYFLLFSISHLIDVPRAYILIEVSQFDSYAYLFNQPIFISLDPDAQPDGIPVAGMRIGINGKEATVGQAYRNLDTIISSASYQAGSGQLLSRLGTILSMEQGPESDEFFLSFERLGSHTNVVLEPVPAQPLPPPDADPAPQIGLRTFDEINASLAAMTGVAPTTPAVRETYLTVRQQLPTVENIEGFLSAHQVGVAQIAIEYCNALVDDVSLRASYFPGVNFAASAATAFDTPAERDLVIDPLLDQALNTGLESQPLPVDVKVELNGLIDNLTACGGGCSADRTATVVKAVCAAALGSAVMLVQ